MRSALARLETTLARRLAAAIEGVGFEVRVLDEPSRAGSGFVLAEMVSPNHVVRWAAGIDAVGSPGPHWGSASHGAVVVRGDHAGPVPDPGVAATPRQLRPELPAGVVAIQLHRELNGRASEFGAKFWNLMLQRVPTLQSLLQDPHARLVRVQYLDRYLRSPLTIRLLYETTKRLAAIVAKGPTKPHIEVRTSYLDYSKSSAALHFDDDWQNEAHRTTTVDNVLRSAGYEVRFVRESTAKLPHARTLQAAWSDGRKLTIALDQGFGSWSEKTKSSYPFRQSEQAQCERLIGAVLDVELRSQHACPVYVHPISSAQTSPGST